MTHRIILTLASDTTETECGACGSASLNQCGAYGLRNREYDHATSKFKRIPECRSAEFKPVGQTVGEEVERQIKDTQ